MSDWVTIDRLGTKGMEADLMSPHRDPPSIDIGVNVRSLGPNIANAGGYKAVAVFPDFNCIPYDDTGVSPPDAANQTKLFDRSAWVTVNSFEFSGGVPFDWELIVYFCLESSDCLQYQDCSPGTLEIKLEGTGVLAGLSETRQINYGFTNGTNDPQEAEVNETYSGSFLIPADGAGGYTIKCYTLADNVIDGSLRFGTGCGGGPYGLSRALTVTCP